MLTSYNLSPIKDGEITSLSFEADENMTIEKMTTLFQSGQSHSANGEFEAAFSEQLQALKCGLIILKKQQPDFSKAISADLRKDISLVMAIGEYVRGATFRGSYDSRFAPVLFNVPASSYRVMELALRDTVNATAPLEVNRYAIEALHDRISVERSLANDDDLEEIEGLELVKYMAKLWVLFGNFTNLAEIAIGMRGEDKLFYEVPVFYVGFTPAGRIGGLLCSSAGTQ